MNLLVGLFAVISLILTVIGLLIGTVAVVVTIRIDAKGKKTFTLSDIFFACAFAAIVFILPFFGGLLWILVCKIFYSTNNAGGPGMGGQLVGWQSFWWGAITLFPIALFARLTTSDFVFKVKKDYLQWFSTRDFLYVLAYPIILGFAATLFYNTGLRDLLSRLTNSIVDGQIVIIVIWALILSCFSGLAVYVTKIKSKGIVANIASVPFSVFLCLCAIITYYGIYDYKSDITFQVRGVAAGYALRLGILTGLLVQLHPCAGSYIYRFLCKKLSDALNKPIESSLEKTGKQIKMSDK